MRNICALPVSVSRATESNNNNNNNDKYKTYIAQIQ